MMGLRFLLKLTAAFALGLALSTIGRAGMVLEPKVVIQNLLKQELAVRYPRARIEINSPLVFQGTPTAAMDRVEVVSDGTRGEVQFVARSPDGAAVVGSSKFSAFVKTPIAQRRIRPTEKLNSGDFKIGEIDVAQGLAREYRGVMLAEDTKLDGLEARLTILEGQYPLVTSLQKVPDVRRGDAVRVRLVSGEITLTTPGVAQEPGVKDGQVRILTTKTKRELVGIVKENGTVEVQL